MIRGVEGFGLKQHLRTDRLLTLSEDLPLVSVAVDTRDRVRAALREVNRLAVRGLVTLERARMVSGRIEPVDLDPDTRIALYRIAQEALANIIRHSGASAVSIALRTRRVSRPSMGPSGVELCIADNGRGFDPDDVLPGHLGLSIMRERAQAAGVELDLRSAPGHGTEVSLRLDRA